MSGLSDLHPLAWHLPSLVLVDVLRGPFCSLATSWNADKIKSFQEWRQSFKHCDQGPGLNSQMMEQPDFPSGNQIKLTF